MSHADESILYKVVVSHEGEYALWVLDRPNNPGWTDEGFVGTLKEVQEHIDEVWTDKRPLSLRKAMEEGERRARGE